LRSEIWSESAMRSASTARNPSPKRSRACRKSLSESVDGPCAAARSRSAPWRPRRPPSARDRWPGPVRRRQPCAQYPRSQFHAAQGQAPKAGARVLSFRCCRPPSAASLEQHSRRVGESAGPGRSRCTRTMIMAPRPAGWELAAARPGRTVSSEWASLGSVAGAHPALAANQAPARSTAPTTNETPARIG
jgi:hypothetical protein